MSRRGDHTTRGTLPGSSRWWSLVVLVSLFLVFLSQSWESRVRGVFFQSEEGRLRHRWLAFGGPSGRISKFEPRGSAFGASWPSGALLVATAAPGAKNWCVWIPGGVRGPIFSFETSWPSGAVRVAVTEVSAKKQCVWTPGKVQGQILYFEAS